MELKFIIPKVLKIWKEVLQTDSIDINTNFFDAGGSSLNVVYVQVLIIENFQIDLEIIDMYQYTTIKKLSELIYKQIKIKKNAFLISVYSPIKEIELGSNTKKFFNTLNKDSIKNDKFDLNSMREGALEFDGDTIIQYPDGISYDSYIDLEINGIKYKNLLVDSKQPTVIYFYGGGFCINMLKSQMSFLANVAHKHNVNIIIPEIKLAPEYSAVEILSECQDFMIRILQKDTNASYIASGWSSGANLALSSVLSVVKYKPHLMKKITSLILLSSWIDLTLDINNFSPYKKQQEQDIFAADSRVLKNLASLYAQGTNYDDLNPLIKYKKQLNHLPRVDVVSGEYDILLGDSIYLNCMLNRQISVCNLHLLKGQTHNYPVFNKIQENNSCVDLYGELILGSFVGDKINYY